MTVKKFSNVVKLFPFHSHTKTTNIEKTHQPRHTLVARAIPLALPTTTPLVTARRHAPVTNVPPHPTNPTHLTNTTRLQFATRQEKATKILPTSSSYHSSPFFLINSVKFSSGRAPYHDPTQTAQQSSPSSQTLQHDICRILKTATAK